MTFHISKTNFRLVLLSHYCSANAILHALMKSEVKFGASLHFIISGVDKGNVIDVGWFDVKPDMTARQVMAIVENTIEQMFDDWLNSILTNDIPATPQLVLCKRLGIEPEYHSRSSLDDLREVDLNWPAARIWNHIRALDFPPFEPAYAVIGEHKVYLRATYEPQQ